MLKNRQAELCRLIWKQFITVNQYVLVLNHLLPNRFCKVTAQGGDFEDSHELLEPLGILGHVMAVEKIRITCFELRYLDNICVLCMQLLNLFRLIILF
jgi:hypothetical protein